MKVLPKLFSVLAVLFSLALSALAQDALNQLLSEAQTAYLRGDVEAAKAKFESVVKLDPKNQTAIGYLRQIRVKEAERGGSPEKALSRLILPSVQYREAELTAVLDALKAQVSKLTEGKQALNFVVQLPAEQAKTSITLSLTNVPFTEVLKYIGALANATFVYDKYAIMVRPASATPPPPEKPLEAPK